MKKKIFKILILIISVCLITILVIRYKTYNNIQEDWIIKISPNYLDQKSNTIYLYEDSYIITNCYARGILPSIVYKRGSLTQELNQDLIEKIKQGKNLEKGNLFFSITLKAGEKLDLLLDEETIKEIEDIINYNGIIWYAQN